jgi:hypothetical protein
VKRLFEARGRSAAISRIPCAAGRRGRGHRLAIRATRATTAASRQARPGAMAARSP